MKRLAIVILFLAGCHVELPQSKREASVPSADEKKLMVTMDFAKFGVHFDCAKGEGEKPVIALRGNNSKITDALLADAKLFPDLQKVSLSTTKVTDVGLIALADLHDLRRLDLSFTKTTGTVLKQLDPRALRELDLTDTPLNEALLPALRTFPQLERLTLAGTPLTDASATELGALTNLRYLHLGRTHITAKTLAALGNLQNLERLMLAETALHGEVFAHLKPLTKLRYIDVRRTEISAADLGELADLKELDTLVLSECPLVDDRALAAVPQLKGLRRLYLAARPGQRPAFTETALEKLHKALPELIVVR